jgi:hypothetical protein
LGTVAFAAAPDRRPSVVEEGERFVFQALEDDQGGFYIIWTHRAGDETFELLGQHVAADAKPLWPRPGAPLATRMINPDDWDAIPDGKGGVIVTWIESFRTRAQRFGAEGKALWPERASVTASTMTSVHPTAVADPSGGAYFVWSEQRYPRRWVLVSQRINGTGAPVWTVEGTRVSLRPSDQRRPRIVMDGQGGAVVAWNDFRENASQVMSQRLDFQGNRMWGAEGVLVTAPASQKDSPLLAPIGDGGAALAWSGSRGAKTRLFLQVLDPKGRFRWQAQGVNLSVGAWDQWNPSLVGDAQGQLWVGWEDFRNHSHWQAFMGQLDKDMHTTWPGSEVPVAPYIADQGRLRFVESGRKGVFVTWVDNRGGRPGVYVQEIDLQGRALLGEEGMPVAKGLSDPGAPQIINLAPGRAAVFYADREKKDRWALYWKAVTGPTIDEKRTNPATRPTTPTTPGPAFPEDDVPIQTGVGEGR